MNLFFLSLLSYFSFEKCRNEFSRYYNAIYVKFGGVNVVIHEYVGPALARAIRFSPLALRILNALPAALGTET